MRILGRDVTGQRFGRLVALAFAHRKLDSSGSRRYFWECRCDCGNKKTINIKDIRDGKIISCGCFAKEVLLKRSVTHGCSRVGKMTPEYSSYHAAKKRCTNPKATNWEFYGGRGIKFLLPSFIEFLRILGPRPEPKKSYSLDRINNNGHYEIGNVRWASWRQQFDNRREKQYR